MPTVQRLCKDFAGLDRISLGETPLDAYNRCHEVAAAFSWYCIGRGIDARLMRLGAPARPIQPPPEVLQSLKADFTDWPDSVHLITHYVTWLPKLEWAVDWTGRQFWPDLPHPWVCRLAEVKKYWKDVDP